MMHVLFFFLVYPNFLNIMNWVLLFLGPFSSVLIKVLVGVYHSFPLYNTANYPTKSRGG